MDGVKKHLNLKIAIIELKFVGNFFYRRMRIEKRSMQKAIPSKTSLSGIRLHFGQKATNWKLEIDSRL